MVRVLKGSGKHLHGLSRRKTNVENNDAKNKDLRLEIESKQEVSISQNNVEGQWV